jgi:hypothetical protein
MHTVELLNHAVDLATRAGYVVREEWLGGSGGGGCEVRGRKLLFLDLALGPAEQFDAVLETLRHDADAQLLPMPHELRDLLAVRRSA